jgi:dienelactone hydrolase
MKVAVAVPSGLPNGSLPLHACADQAGKVREGAEGNNCRKVGVIRIAAATLPATPATPTGSAAASVPIDPGGLTGPTAPASSVPTNPVPFSKGTPFTLSSSASDYWVFVPNSYDATHATPTTLFVWLHGCGGLSSGDIYTVSPGGSQDWISVAVGGREGQCWDPDTDQPLVLAAIADMKTHFNIDPRRVILGGYSSGGDLAYRTAFYNSTSFAGLLIVNSSPFRDTGSTQAASLAAATSKFHVVHLAHLQDSTYPISGVRKETEAMISAGFPLTRVEVDGGHYDEAGAIENGHAVPGTDADIATYLLPHIDDGWLSP